MKDEQCSSFVFGVGEHPEQVACKSDNGCRSVLNAHSPAIRWSLQIETLHDRVWGLFVLLGASGEHFLNLSQMAAIGGRIVCNYFGTISCGHLLDGPARLGECLVW